jgi:hypothetical protein
VLRRRAPRACSPQDQREEEGISACLAAAAREAAQLAAMQAEAAAYAAELEAKRAAPPSRAGTPPGGGGAGARGAAAAAAAAAAARPATPPPPPPPSGPDLVLTAADVATAFHAAKRLAADSWRRPRAQVTPRAARATLPPVPYPALPAWPLSHIAPHTQPLTRRARLPAPTALRTPHHPTQLPQHTLARPRLAPPSILPSTPPQVAGQLVLESFDWRSPGGRPGRTVLRLRSLTSNAALLELPRGCHVLRIASDALFLHAVTFMSQQQCTVGEYSQVRCKGGRRAPPPTCPSVLPACSALHPALLPQPSQPPSPPSPALRPALR